MPDTPETRSAPTARTGARRRGVRPGRLLVLVSVVVVVAVVAIIVLLLGGREPAGVELVGFSEDSTATVSFAGLFPQDPDDPLSNPLGIDGDGERLYVAEADEGRIAVFTYEGGLWGTIEIPVAPDAPRAYPVDVAVVDDETLAVVDTAGSRVVLVRADPDDDPAPSVVVAGAGPVTAVAATDDEVYVAFGEGVPLRVFAPDGTPLRDFGEDLAPRLAFVGSLSLDGDALVISDATAGRVLMVDAGSGEPLDTAGIAFGLAGGAERVQDGRVFASDVFGGTVNVLDQELELSDTIGGASIEGADRPFAGAGLLSRPQDVTWLESEDRLYVTDSLEGVVRIYNVRPEVP